jgi:hypothetical protein
MINSFKEGLQLVFDIVLWFVGVLPIWIVGVVFYLSRKALLNKVRLGRGNN